MKRLLTLFFVFTAAFLISSCATFYPNQKYLIGTWKPINIEKYSLQEHQNPVAGTEGKTNSGEGGTTHSSGMDRQTFNEKKQNVMADLKSSMAFYSDKTSSLTFKTNKTAIKEYQGKTVDAKWKLTNHGTRLLINSKEPGKKTTYDILHISDTTAIMTESFSILSMKITYRKVKK